MKSPPAARQPPRTSPGRAQLGSFCGRQSGLSNRKTWPSFARPWTGQRPVPTQTVDRASVRRRICRPARSHETEKGRRFRGTPWLLTAVLPAGQCFGFCTLYTTGFAPTFPAVSFPVTTNRCSPAAETSNWPLHVRPPLAKVFVTVGLQLLVFRLLGA